MIVYAIRHGESQSNAKLHGGLDAPLTALGVAQSKALAIRLAGQRITAIYSSPFRRCLQTALPIAEVLGLPVRLRGEMSEYHHLPEGAIHDLELEGPEKIAADFPGAGMCPDCDQNAPWPRGDESMTAMLTRTATMALYLKGRWRDATDAVVVISHGSPIARLIEAWLTPQPGPAFRFVIDNATVSALRHHIGVSSLVCLNEASHLRGLPVPAGANYREDGSIKAEPATQAW